MRPAANYFEGGCVKIIHCFKKMKEMRELVMVPVHAKKNLIGLPFYMNTAPIQNWSKPQIPVKNWHPLFSTQGPLLLFEIHSRFKHVFMLTTAAETKI